MDTHLVITLHETFLSFLHSDGRSGTQPTPNGGERADMIDYITTLFPAQTLEIILA
jgi:hypothetical protein